MPVLAWLVLSACAGVKLLPPTTPTGTSAHTGDADTDTDTDTDTDADTDTDTDPDPVGHTGTTPTGGARSVDDLLPGDLVITEIFRDPSAVSDDLGEWFEVLNPTGEAVDLFGLEVVDDGGDAATITFAVVIPPGGYAVLARSASTSANGGVAVDATFTGMSLGNGDDEIELRALNGTLDRVAWDGAWPSASGAAMSLGASTPTAAGNDAPGAWCDAVTPFGDGDLGTPGAANPGC